MARPARLTVDTRSVAAAALSRFAAQSAAEEAAKQSHPLVVALAAFILASIVATRHTRLAARLASGLARLAAGRGLLAARRLLARRRRAMRHHVARRVRHVPRLADAHL